MANRYLCEKWTHLCIEAVAVHPQVPRGIPETQQPGRHVNTQTFRVVNRGCVIVVRCLPTSALSIDDDWVIKEGGAGTGGAPYPGAPLRAPPRTGGCAAPMGAAQKSGSL